MCYQTSILLASLLLFSSCKNPSQTTNNRSTLKQIDDHPLYEMVYVGDYGFDSFLESGISSVSREQKRGWACTCFSTTTIDDNVILGRNFDWYDHPALILFTDPPNGYASVSMVDISYLGFDKNDRVSADDARLNDAPFLPFDGMNEHGLAVGMMAVPYAQAPVSLQKVTLGSLHIIRLVLDFARDIDEAIDFMDDYNIDFEGGPAIHYFLADQSGSSAVIEFVDNEMVVLHNKKPWQVSTNFIICQTDLDGADSYCWRYNLTYSTLEQNQGQITSSQTMDILESVSQSNTRWSVVYNTTSQNINLVMGRDYQTAYNWVLAAGNQGL